MLNSEDSIKSPSNRKNHSDKQPETIGNGQKDDTLFSPRFRSVAAMAGWDEEALLIASFIVEDTPDRQSKHKKRSDLQSFKSPPTNSRRKRKAQKRSPAPIPAEILDLDEDESNTKQDSEKINKETNIIRDAEKKKGDDEVDCTGSGVSSSTAVIPCIEKLREELSCAICLEICYEPSTTSCGHSFCKKCLCSAADKCGKRCPKCRQLISNSRYCTVNTVLWNTIQLLFPGDVGARKVAASASADSQDRTSPARGGRRGRTVVALNSPEPESSGPERRSHHRMRSQRSSRPMSSSGDVRMGRELPSQDEDAALALRLQREEFMEAFRAPNGGEGRSRNSFAVARANLRAMASRAINIRIRGGPTR